MMKKIKVYFVLIFLISLSPFCLAEVYKWVDENGEIHYSDKPVSDKADKIDLPELPVVDMSNNPAGAAGQRGEKNSQKEKTNQGSGQPLTGKLKTRAVLIFDGLPITKFTKTEPTISVRLRDSNTWITPNIDYDDKSGELVLSGFAAGNYNASIKIDANHFNGRDYPGDFSGHFNFAPAEEGSKVTVHMQKQIRLLLPQDNNNPLMLYGAPCEKKIAFKGPMKFKWESMGEDVIYTYSVTRTECKPFKWRETVAGETTTNTSVSVELPPNNAGEHYMLRLKAHKHGRQIGTFMVHGGNGYAWDYRFRIIP